MNRDAALSRLKSERFDLLVIGGGATGLGCALDAAARGYATGLIESRDFAHATSSRSTKLAHGGVRYLRQGNFRLVREALVERTRMRDNAPDYVRELAFFVPARTRLQLAWYAAGLKLYDALADGYGFQPSRIARGGVIYWDAQFDDARLAVALARTASEHGAATANYVRAVDFRYANGHICGVDAVDSETEESFSISARSVINATGIFIDALRTRDDARVRPLLTFSRGSHIVVDKSVLVDPRKALLVPKTEDDRVLFAIPWHEGALIGTTEVAAAVAQTEPIPSDEEIAYLIRTVNPYLAKPIDRHSIRSAFAGLRPLVNRSRVDRSRLSREHLIEISPSGLITVAGGKWTTYRLMAQEAVSVAAHECKLPSAGCRTKNLPLLPDDAPAEQGDRVAHAVRHEMARTVEDVLARRTNQLFRDADAARSQATPVAAQLACLLGHGQAWADEQAAAFTELAKTYTVDV